MRLQAAFEVGSRVLCDAPWDDKQKCASLPARPSRFISTLGDHMRYCYLLTMRLWHADLAEVVDFRRAADGTSSYYIHYHDSACPTARICMSLESQLDVPVRGEAAAAGIAGGGCCPAALRLQGVSGVSCSAH